MINVEIKNGCIYRYTEEACALWIFLCHENEPVDPNTLTSDTNVRIYERGDFIAKNKYEERFLFASYKEFAEEQTISLGRTIFSLLGITGNETHEIAFKISRIFDHETSPEAFLRPYLVLKTDKENLLLELNYTTGQGGRFDPLDLSVLLRGDSSAFTSGVSTMIGVSLNLLSFGTGSLAKIGLKTVAKKLGVSLLDKAAKRRLIKASIPLLKKLFTKEIPQRITLFLGSVAKDSTLEFGKKYYSQLKEDKLKGKNPQLKPHELNVIVGEAFFTALGKNITGEILKAIESVLPGGGKDFISESEKRKITSYITRKISIEMLSPTVSILEMALKSVKFSPSNDSKNTFLIRFEQNILMNLKRRFSLEYVSNLIKGAVGDLDKAFND